MSASVDPRLAIAIRNGKSKNGTVHAAFTLRAPNGQILSPETTARIVTEIVGKASLQTSKTPQKVVVFKNLQSFAIEASADLVERITDEDTIGTAALGS